MAGVIKNVIRTLFTSSGADTVQSDIARLTRGQTRLGQSSAGAGRQFAAQASGLGGLVAAYAGAAATSFALGAAFDALSKSARSMQTIEGVSTLAAGVAQSGSDLLKSVQEITKGQLTLADAAAQTSLALSAGFNTNQIEALSEVALKASRALGRDLADSMTRVVRGSAKMETELLDELGIYTKIEPATRAYAAAIGKNVTALSEFERRQAFANAVIVEGQRKFNAINTILPTTSEQIESLGARMSDLATQLGAGIADLLAPLAGGIVDNVAASFGALGLVLSLVAGKAVSLFTSSMTALVASMNASLLTNENNIRARLGLTAVVLKATDANKALADSMLRVSAADKASLGVLRTAAGTRALSGKEIKESNKLLKANEQLLKTEKTQLIANAAQIRANYTSIATTARDASAAAARAAAVTTAARLVPAPGGLNTPAAREKAQAVRAAAAAERAAVATATAATAAKTAALATLQPQIIANNTLLTSNTAAITANTLAINANTAAITGWRARLAGATSFIVGPFIKAIGNLGAVFGSVLGAASKLFFIVSIFQLIGTSIANALGKGDEFNAFFSNLGKTVSSFIAGQKAKAMKSTMLSIAGGALSDIEAIDSQIRNVEGFTFRKKSILGVEIEITKTKEQLVKEVSNILADVGTESGKSLGKSLTSSLALSLGGLGLAVGSFFTPIGAAIGGAVGLAIGTGWDYFMSSDEATAAVKEYGKDISNKFAEELAALPTAAQKSAIKALSIIQERYGAKALIDPAARAAKTLQEDLIFRSVKYLEVTAAIGQAMAATAKSADELTKTFQFDKAIGSAEYLQTAITAIGKETVTFTFVDDMNDSFKQLKQSALLTGEDLFNSLNAANQPIQIISTFSATTVSEDEVRVVSDKIAKLMATKIREGVAEEDILGSIRAKVMGDEVATAILDRISVNDIDISTFLTSIESAYNAVAGANNSAQQGLLRTTAILASTNDELARGTLTMERYSQNTSNVGDALIKVAQDLATAKSKLPELNKQLSNAMNVNDASRASQLQLLISGEEERIRNNESILAISRAELDIQLSKGNAIREQIELTDFLKDQGKGVMSDIAFNFELAKAGAENAAAASANYFATILKGNKDASISASNYQTQLSTELAANKTITDSLNYAQKQALRSASKENLALTATTLNGIAGIAISAADETISINGKVIGVVTQTSQDALTTVSLSTDAMKKIAQDALLEATSLAKKLGDTITETIVDVTEQLRTIEAEKTTAKIQFEIDSLNLDMEAAKAAREFNIAFLENKIKLTELSVEEKQTKPVAGAEQINTYESDILAQRRLLLEDEKRISQEIYEKEQAAATEAVIMEKDRIDLEIKARIDAITSEYNLLRDAVITYHSIASTLETAIVTGGNTMGQTIVSALNAGVKAFADSLGPLGDLLNIKPQVAAFTAAPLPGSAVVGYTAGQVVTETEVQIGKDLAPIFSGVHDATTAIATLGDAEKEAANERFRNDLALRGRRHAAELLDYDRQVALLMQETELSEGAARNRLEEAKAAEAAGGGAADAAEAVELLTGRLADLQSTIKGSLESAFMSINDLIIQGAQDGKDAGEVLRDVISGLFNTIQQEVFKQTIATPLADMISNWVVGGIKQLNLTDIRGSSLSGVLGSARGATGEDLTKNVMSDKAILAGGEAFKKAGATISNGIASLGTGVNAAAGAGASAVSGAAGMLATTTRTSTGVVASANVAGASTLMSSLGPILAVLAVIAVIAGLFNRKKNEVVASQAPSTITTTSSISSDATRAVPSNLNTAPTSINSIPKTAVGGLRDSVPTPSYISSDAARAVPANLNTTPASINSMPKMAIGGLRDRVPTMLEPGEFVIRKPMVNRIGTPALESMNATGKVPNPAPVINIKNEGSPKDATASPPRFDGEKYVIDIVMRDLANNGPIRKSLRGGAI